MSLALLSVPRTQLKSVGYLPKNSNVDTPPNELCVEGSVSITCHLLCHELNVQYRI